MSTPGSIDGRGGEVLRLDGVTRAFGSSAATIVAVDDVDLVVAAGEIVALVGPSGSGKTTLLNLVLGWEQPSSGIVRSATARNDWRSAAVVPQELGLLPELTAIENVRLTGRLSGRRHDRGADGGDVSNSDIEGRVGDVFDALELGGLEDRYPDELSMGEQQRVAVARAVVLAPELLVADEPTAHQDERRVDLVMAQLVAVARQGGAVLVATHDERLLDRVDRVVRMLDGRLVG